MGLVPGWGTAVKLNKYIYRYFKLDFILFFYFVWPLNVIFLSSFYLGTTEQTGLQETGQLEYSFMQNIVHSGTHKNEARSRNNIETSPYSTFKACHSQKKGSVHFISYMYFQMLGFILCQPSWVERIPH